MECLITFWYLLISRRATVPGRYLWGFLTPPAAGADLRAAMADGVNGKVNRTKHSEETLVRTLCSELLAGCFASSRLSGGLLGSVKKV